MRIENVRLMFELQGRYRDTRGVHHEYTLRYGPLFGNTDWEATLGEDDVEPQVVRGVATMFVNDPNIEHELRRLAEIAFARHD